jgi:hypothetical protein
VTVGLIGCGTAYEINSEAPSLPRSESSDAAVGSGVVLDRSPLVGSFPLLADD